MSKFKVGDRVVAWAYGNTYRGEVVDNSRVNWGVASDEVAFFSDTSFTGAFVSDDRLSSWNVEDVVLESVYDSPIYRMLLNE